MLNETKIYCPFCNQKIAVELNEHENYIIYCPSCNNQIHLNNCLYISPNFNDSNTQKIINTNVVNKTTTVVNKNNNVETDEYEYNELPRTVIVFEIIALFSLIIGIMLILIAFQLELKLPAILVILGPVLIIDSLFNFAIVSVLSNLNKIRFNSELMVKLLSKDKERFKK